MGGPDSYVYIPIMSYTLQLLRKHKKRITDEQGVFSWFHSDADKKVQTRSREQLGVAKKRKEFQAHSSCPLSMSCVSKDRKLCGLFRNNGSIHKAALGSIDSLDIL